MKKETKDKIVKIAGNAAESIREAKTKFGMKWIVAALLVLLVLASYVGGGWYLLNLKKEFTQLQGLYDQKQREHQIEIDAAIVAERQKVIDELERKYKILLQERDKKRAERKAAEKVVTERQYERINEDASRKMDRSALVDGFTDLGIVPSASK